VRKTIAGKNGRKDPKKGGTRSIHHSGQGRNRWIKNEKRANLYKQRKNGPFWRKCKRGGTGRAGQQGKIVRKKKGLKASGGSLETKPDLQAIVYK